MVFSVVVVSSPGETGFSLWVGVPAWVFGVCTGLTSSPPSLAGEVVGGCMMGAGFPIMQGWWVWGLLSLGVFVRVGPVPGPPARDRATYKRLGREASIPRLRKSIGGMAYAAL